MSKIIEIRHKIEAIDTLIYMCLHGDFIVYYGTNGVESIYNNKFMLACLNEYEDLVNDLKKNRYFYTKKYRRLELEEIIQCALKNAIIQQYNDDLTDITGLTPTVFKKDIDLDKFIEDLSNNEYYLELSRYKKLFGEEEE